MVGWINGWMVKWLDGWKDEWMDGWMVGKMNGWMVGCIVGGWASTYKIVIKTNVCNSMGKSFSGK